LVGDPFPGELGAGTLAPGGAETAAELRVSEKPFQRRPKRDRIARRHDDPGLAVDDQVTQAPDAGRHHGTAVSHRFEAGDAEALATRGAGNDRSPREEALELVVLHEPTRHRHAVSQWTIARNYEPQPFLRLDQLEPALLRRESTRIQDLRRLGLIAYLRREIDAARNHAHVICTKSAGPVCQVAGRSDHEPRAAQ